MEYSLGEDWRGIEVKNCDPEEEYLVGYAILFEPLSSLPSCHVIPCAASLGPRPLSSFYKCSWIEWFSWAYFISRRAIRRFWTSQ